MSEHHASVEWHLQAHPEQSDTYSRDHKIQLENGQSILNSSAPAFLGNAQASNPETLLLAALASCHMLTFLALAQKRGCIVLQYQDTASGTLGKNNDGRMAIAHVTLNPKVEFQTDTAPTNDELAKLHDSAHRNCFIANSLNMKIDITF